MTTAYAAEQSPRPPHRLLMDREFGFFFAGKLFSSVGVWIQNITAALLVFEITRSATMVGLVSVFQFAPQVFLAPWVGSIVDRLDRRILLLAGRLLSFLAAVGLGTWLFAVGGHGLPGVWPVHLTAFLLGVGLSLSGPAQNALIPALVKSTDLFGAVSLSNTTANIARAVGPAIGAFVFLNAGPAIGFGMSAAGHLLFLLAVLSLSTRSVPAQGTDSSVRAGLRYLREVPLLLALLVCVAAIGFAADAVITLTPPLAEEFDLNEGFVGTLASIFGVGAVVALLLSHKLQARVGLPRLGLVGFAAMMVGFGLVAISPLPWIALGGMFLAGTGFLLSTSSVTSRIQVGIPDQLRGRIMALWGVGFLGARPIAATVHGFVADVISVRIAFLIPVLVVALGGFIAFRTQYGVIPTEFNVAHG